MTMCKRVSFVVLLCLLVFISGCSNERAAVSSSQTENICPEFYAKACSAWDRPIYFKLSSKGEVSVYRSRWDYSLDEFMVGGIDLTLECQKLLSPEELQEINSAFNNIGVWEEETMNAYDLRVVDSYYLNSYQHFYMASYKNLGYVKVMELLIQYSIGTVYYDKTG